MKTVVYNIYSSGSTMVEMAEGGDLQPGVEVVEIEERRFHDVMIGFSQI